MHSISNEGDTIVKYFLGLNPKKRGMAKHFVMSEEDKVKMKNRGKVLLIKETAGYFYFVQYGKREAGSGYITEYHYDDIHKQFYAGSMIYYGIYELMVKTSVECEGE